MALPTPNPADINLLASFLAHQEIPFLSLSSLSSSSATQIDCIALCGSAILHTAESVFSFLQQRSTTTQPITLVIAGGIGHSTPLLYAAVRSHPRYGPFFADRDLTGLAEARVLEIIGRELFGLDGRKGGSIRVLVDDRSTNCGANAVETGRVLDEAGVRPRGIIVVQDPTMSLRTKAAFGKVFNSDGDGEEGVRVWACPTFVPRFIEDEGGLRFEVIEGLRAEGLWSMERFLDLLVGEIPRVRDDEGGYGPRGKGFIVHVDVPEEVEGAWRRLKEAVGVGRVAV